MHNNSTIADDAQLLLNKHAINSSGHDGRIGQY